ILGLYHIRLILFLLFLSKVLENCRWLCYNEYDIVETDEEEQ
ncbi:hypothetical protein HMPREF9099_02863, partial [Lachnospiraceae bacterium oral taxon 082 str. F0431]